VGECALKGAFVVLSRPSSWRENEHVASSDAHHASSADEGGVFLQGGREMLSLDMNSDASSTDEGMVFLDR